MNLRDDLRYPEARAGEEIRELTRERIRREEEDQNLLTEYEARHEKARKI